MEVEEYLNLLNALDLQVKDGKRVTIGTGQVSILQQRILYSAVYLQLYNLVEVTITRCVEAVRNATSEGRRWKPADLSKQLREEWASLTAQTKLSLNEENRRQRAVELCEHIVNDLPVIWPSAVPPGGNWDDSQIERISAHLGCELEISEETKTAVKRRVHDEMGQLTFIKDRRNRLAHGSLSFAECGAAVTIDDLQRTKECTVLYLTEVLSAFEEHIVAYKFLAPDRRPVPDTTGPIG